jgi:hypothetical protein
MAPHSSHPVSPFFYGDEVEFEYDPKTRDVWVEKKAHNVSEEEVGDPVDDDGTWCLSPMMRRTRSQL